MSPAHPALAHGILLDWCRSLLIHGRVLEPAQGAVLVLLVRAGDRPPSASQGKPAYRAVQDHAVPETAFLANRLGIVRDMIWTIAFLAGLVILEFHVGTGNYDIPASSPPD